MRGRTIMATMTLAALLVATAEECPAQNANADDAISAAKEDLTVLSADADGGTMLSRWLKAEAHAALARRKEAYESLKTPEDIAAWQQARREFFIERLGGFPERTPLEPRVVGRLPGDGFRVEKVIFHSRPQHAVTAILFLPDPASGRREPAGDDGTRDPAANRGADAPRSPVKYPAVIIPCGHTANGKAAGAYQQLARLHAINGIAAMVYDPIGQGERYQLLDEAGKPRFKSTGEHTLVGTCAIPLGWNCATFRVWDGIRALDYLASRDDIDATRLGCTGNSGGGTLTEYLMSIDERIVCAAPGSCVTTFGRRIETIGPGDAEQNIFGQIGFGLDHADYTIMRAPRPTLLLAGTQDFIDIRGSWEIHREANRIYTRLGHPERIDLVEHDGPHGYQKPLREAAVSWMVRWLKNEDRRVTETPWEPFAARDVQCTDRGQVLLEPGARSVFDIMADEDARLAEVRAKFLKEATPEEVRKAVREIAGIGNRKRRVVAREFWRDAVDREGYRILRVVDDSASPMPRPTLQFEPGVRGDADVFLYINDSGKAADAAPGGAIEKLVRQGRSVYAIDLPGLGETAPKSGTFRTSFMTYLLGQSLAGIRADEIVESARMTRSMTDDQLPKPTLHVIAIGEAGPPALHAVALHPEMFDSLKLVGSLESWSSVVRTPVTRNQLPQVVHGALRTYDLPDLVKLLPEGFVTIEDPRGADGRPLR